MYLFYGTRSFTTFLVLVKFVRITHLLCYIWEFKQTLATWNIFQMEQRYMALTIRNCHDIYHQYALCKPFSFIIRSLQIILLFSDLVLKISFFFSRPFILSKKNFLTHRSPLLVGMAVFAKLFLHITGHLVQ